MGIISIALLNKTNTTAFSVILCLTKEYQQLVKRNKTSNMKYTNYNFYDPMIIV